MIPESIAAIPSQEERVVSLIAKKRAPDREFINARAHASYMLCSTTRKALNIHG